MKKNLILPIFASAILFSCSDTADIDIDRSENENWELTTSLALNTQETATVETINDISYTFISKVNEGVEKSESYTFSPISLSIYMGMLANAAGGESRAEILDMFNVNDINTLNHLNRKLMHYLPCEDNGAYLAIANRYWVADNYTVNEGFKTALAENYNGVVDYVDFSVPTTVPAINKWAYDNTNGMIPEILLGNWEDYSDKKVIGANAVYFQGSWEKEFKESATDKEMFYGKVESKEVDMMHQTLNTSYNSDENVQLVMKYYDGQKNRAEFYLPAENVDVRDLVTMLTPDRQKDLCEGSESRTVILSLPKFAQKKDLPLTAAVCAMGVNLGNVDLSGIGVDGMDSGITQYTSIKVDEYGTELAAVTTGIVISPMPTEEVEVKFNRPFYYIIRNVDTGIILMAGVVADIFE